jgi:hypothetical protein
MRRVPPHASYAALAVDEWLASLSYKDLRELDKNHEFVYVDSDSEDEESTHYPIQTDREWKEDKLRNICCARVYRDAVVRAMDA